MNQEAVIVAGLRAMPPDQCTPQRHWLYYTWVPSSADGNLSLSLSPPRFGVCIFLLLPIVFLAKAFVLDNFDLDTRKSKCN